MESSDQNNEQSSVSDSDADQLARTSLRRTSSRLASRRLTTPSAPPPSTTNRPIPPHSVRHLSTWISQNRAIERQRSFYSSYYSSPQFSNRNRGSQSNANRSSQPTSTAISSTTASSSSTATVSSPRASAAPSVGPIDTSNLHALAAAAARHSADVPRLLRIPISVGYESEPEGETEIVRINNAATQTTSSTTVSPAEIDVPATTPNNGSSPSSAPAPPPNPSIPTLMTPFHEYLRHLGAFITFGRNPAFLIPNSEGNSAATNSDNADNDNTNNIDIEPLNFEALFGISDSLFNSGLTKQEINRHTISYEYKAALPAKRKRMKTEEGEAPAPTQALPNGTADNCSICLDKFNLNVQVRRLPCLHVFHIKCIDKWLKRNKKCPICRIAININYDTLMSSLESGSTIDQCLSQQESSSRPSFRPTITVSLQSGGSGGGLTLSGFTATVELNSNSSSSAGGSNSRSTGTN